MSELEKLLKLETTANINKDVENIIIRSKEAAYKSVNITLIIRNWLIGYRISKQILGNKTRSENYGMKLMSDLSKYLTEKYGKGFTKSNIYSFYQFYKIFPNIFQTMSGKSQKSLLSWSHYVVLLQVSDNKARDWYEKEAYKESWSVRTLQRNISSQYYYRILKSWDKEPVIEEMKKITKPYDDKLEYIKSPIIAEFLGYNLPYSYNESDLETSIISNIQNTLMELGKGYAFVSRQYHIHTEKEDYYIDLVFYNYILKCFVLIDLKTRKISHQDIGQMDMYVRMFDELKKMSDDNPTLGIILCSETDEDIAKYSILNGNDQLFQTKYKLYLPDEEELKKEIEKQKDLYYTNKKEEVKR